MTFVFYDTETTGTDTTFDQILQIAAVVTDDELRVLDQFNLRCRLLPYIVPSPGALLVTGIQVSDLQSAALSHFEMMREVHRQLREWSARGAIFLGWNSLRFDEHLLRQAFYQCLLPPYLTNTGSNGRGDVMRMAQVVAACAPGLINVPLQDGGPTFRLSAIAEANGILLDDAHDALADTMATLDVARLIRARAPEIWSRMILNAVKRNTTFLLNQPVLLLSETFGGVPHLFNVAPIGSNASNPNEWAVFDLQHDPEAYLEMDEAELRAAMDGDERPIRRVTINAQPRLLPLSFQPAFAGDQTPGPEALQRAAVLRNTPLFRKRIGQVLAARYADQEPSIHLEQQIYDRFPSPADEGRMAEFHEADWPERAYMLGQFEDSRYQRLAQRLLAVERPDLLSLKQQKRWEEWCRQRFMPLDTAPWRTLDTALAEMESVEGEIATDRLSQSAAIRRFLEQIRSAVTKRAPKPSNPDQLSLLSADFSSEPGRILNPEAVSRDS